MANWEVGPSGYTYTTPQQALDALYSSVGGTTFTETQTILIHAGTYIGTTTVPVSLAPDLLYRLNIQAATGETVILDGVDSSTYASAIIGSSINNILIKGITCRDYYGYAIASLGNYCVVSNNNISNTKDAGRPRTRVYGIYCGTNANIYDNSVSDFQTWGIVAGATSVILRNICKGATVPDSWGQQGIRIAAHSDDASVYNNLIINSQTGIILVSGINGSIYNNTVYYAGTDASSIGIYVLDEGWTVENNVVDYSTGFTYAVYADAITSDNNVFYYHGTAKCCSFKGVPKNTLANWQGVLSQDAASYNTNPLFVSAGGSGATDYKITSSSDCKDHGIDLSGSFTTDYFGTTRPQGISFDIGFHELILTNISSFMRVPYASIASVNGVAKASISKIMGVS